VNDQQNSADALAALEAKGDLFTSASTAAVVLGRNYRTVLAAIERGDIPHTRMGQQYMVPVAWLRRQADGVTA
jgi:excisionase family DNA binding protein